MALTLLDGTAAAVDLTLSGSNQAGASGLLAGSFRCTASSIEYEFDRSFQNVMTLCSGQDVSEVPSTRQHFIRMSRFASMGTTTSDLSPLYSATSAAGLTFTAGTGCSKTGYGWLDKDTFGASAGQVAMPGSVSFRSCGGMATVWVIT